jgi:parallel beta-helix repeat protein
MNAILDKAKGHSRRRLMSLVVLPLAALVAFGAVRAPSGSAAAAVDVSCGQILTANTTVSNDLTDCPASGLVIGAAGITVDLNGHTIDGTSQGAGILNNGFADATIKNGELKQFEDGVFTTGAHNRLQGLRTRGNQTGIFGPQGSLELQVTGSVAFDNATVGILVLGDETHIANSAANNNGTAGIKIATGSGSTVTGSKALSNASGIAFGGEGGEVTGNIANGNDLFGISVSDPTTTLSKNIASFNTQLGIDAQSGGVIDGGGNKAVGNGSLHQCENVVCTSS